VILKLVLVYVQRFIRFRDEIALISTE
jgi:hypothetical protein